MAFPPASDEVQPLLADLEHIDFRAFKVKTHLSDRTRAFRRLHAKIQRSLMTRAFDGGVHADPTIGLLLNRFQQDPQMILHG